MQLIKRGSSLLTCRCFLISVFLSAAPICMFAKVWLILHWCQNQYLSIKMDKCTMCTYCNHTHVASRINSILSITDSHKSAQQFVCLFGISHVSSSWFLSSFCFLPPFFPSQTQYLTPKSPSPVNLPAHYTPAIAASPLRQVEPTVTAHLCFTSHLSSPREVMLKICYQSL